MTKRILTAASAIAFLLAAPISVSAGSNPAGIRVEGVRFVDGAGREVILRGVNAGGRSKLPPFYPFEAKPDFQAGLEKYADGIRDMGFNVVRMLVIYEAAEPERGKYDEEYLKKYDAMVGAFSRRGIYVIVDSHQDLFSRRFCGDGFPDWALPEKYRSMPAHADCKNWGLRDFTWPVASTLDDFWSGKDGVQESYAAFFKMLAERYKDEPAVIGFEPINEPFPGNRGRLSIGWWYEHQLFPLYKRVADATQSVDKRFLIFADICPLENPRLWSTRRPRPDIKNLVYAPHYYDLGTFGILSESGLEKKFMRGGLKKQTKQRDFWNAPMLVGEYGISPLHKSAARYLTNLYSVFDALKISGTFWEASMSAVIWNMENTSVFNPDGTVRPAARSLDRPYPRAVAGTIKSFAFDPEGPKFELTWQEQPGISAPTEIYLPRAIFTDSPKVSLEPGADFEFDRPASLVKVRPSGRNMEMKAVVKKP